MSWSAPKAAGNVVLTTPDYERIETATVGDFGGRSTTIHAVMDVRSGLVLPRKTSHDVERVLAIGVHAAERLGPEVSVGDYVVCVGDPPDEFTWGEEQVRVRVWTLLDLCSHCQRGNSRHQVVAVVDGVAETRPETGQNSV